MVRTVNAIASIMCFRLLQFNCFNVHPTIKSHPKKMRVFLGICLFFIYSKGSYAKCTDYPVLQTYSKLSVPLYGRLIYHSYSSYNDGSSNLFLRDFRFNTLTQLNQDFWNIEDPMNAHFSSNGHYITFMGKQNSRWNIFIWKLSSLLAPINLSNHTQEADGRSEDPKFSLDGNYIVYKNNSDIAMLHLNFTNAERPFSDASWKITNNGYLTEESMPYLSANGKSIFYSQGAGAASGIYQVNFKNNGNKLIIGLTSLVSNKENSANYYPIVQNKSLFFVGWKNYFSRNDQIYFLPNSEYRQSIELSLNDCNANNADPVPVDTTHIIFSSTRNNKFYKLYLGNIHTGKVYYINKFNFNQEFKNELGATYTNVR